MSLTLDADTSWIEQFKLDHGTKHLLAMSRGKDALASWLVMRRHGIEVVPYHLYLVPGLEFVQESLDYLERVFGVKIVDLPHRSFFMMLNNLIYQPPERVAWVEEWDPKVPSYKTIEAEVRDMTGAHDAKMTGSGVRAADSMARRGSFMKYGHIRTATDGRETFFPVWNFTKGAVFEILRLEGIRLPDDYTLFKCSFDGITPQFLGPLARHRPRDYQRILEWFPLAEIGAWRYEQAQK